MLVFRSYFHKKGALLKNLAHCISVRVALAHKQHQRISSITRISSMLASGYKPTFKMFTFWADIIKKNKCGRLP